MRRPFPDGTQTIAQEAPPTPSRLRVHGEYSASKQARKGEGGTRKQASKLRKQSADEDAMEASRAMNSVHAASEKARKHAPSSTVAELYAGARIRCRRWKGGKKESLGYRPLPGRRAMGYGRQRGG